MSRRHLIHGIVRLLSVLTLLSPCGATSQPLLPTGDNEYGGTPGMHLFLPSHFIQSIREDRLLLARTRYYSAAYQQAAVENHPERALAYADSLIRISKRYSIPSIQHIDCYKHRAQALHALGQTKEACIAYNQTVMIQDSLMRLEQTEAIREMQASYELDRLALDRALLKAKHHKITLISLALLLLAAAVGIGFIYVSNRRIKQLQRELLLQMNDSAKSEEKKIAFINSICHEVRTPLNCISGFSGLLCSEDIGQDAYAQYCEIIRDNCHQLRYIFDDIIEVAFLEGLCDPLPLNYMDIGALCRSQIKSMKVRFPKRGVSYTSSIPTEEIGMSSNPKYLTMLVAALLNNAYKFTQSGSVEIACGHADENRVFIAITDTGCGIPAAHQEEVFERFVKLDTFTTGNGLGLYLCRLIARHLGGEIYIDGAYTEGTRVVVTLQRK